MRRYILLLVDYSAVSTMDDVEFCQWLTREHGVAAIPLSVFCADPFPHKLIRLCLPRIDVAGSSRTPAPAVVI